MIVASASFVSQRELSQPRSNHRCPSTSTRTNDFGKRLVFKGFGERSWLAVFCLSHRFHDFRPNPVQPDLAVLGTSMAPVNVKAGTEGAADERGGVAGVRGPTTDAELRARRWTQFSAGTPEPSLRYRLLPSPLPPHC